MRIAASTMAGKSGFVAARSSTISSTKSFGVGLGMVNAPP